MFYVRSVNNDFVVYTKKEDGLQHMWGIGDLYESGVLILFAGTQTLLCHQSAFFFFQKLPFADLSEKLCLLSARFWWNVSRGQRLPLSPMHYL